MKSLLIGLGIFLFTFSAWAGTFVETFDERKLEEWQELIMLNLDAAQASWDILDGELHAISQAGLISLLTIGDKTWRDYEIEFDVKPIKKHGLGSIAIAARRNKTWILVCMIGDMDFPVPESKATCFGGNFHDNRFEIFNSEAAPVLTLETWSHLKLRVDGAIFTFWINGKQVLEATDHAAHLPAGGVGLGLANYTARFDNIVITGNGIPNKGRLSVTPQAKLATTWGSLKRF